jgi:uncharacterized membrane protein (DUF2068 family)
MSQSGPRVRNEPRLSDGTLAIIGAFKLFKGLLLLGVAIGALHLLHRDIADTLAPLIAHLHIDPESRYLDRALTALWALDDRALKRISAGTFFYAALLLTEGVGLLLRQRWAEYFTVVITGSFVPLELYELARRFTATRLLIIGVNVVIVWYLVRHLRQRSAGPPAATLGARALPSIEPSGDEPSRPSRAARGQRCP